MNRLFTLGILTIALTIVALGPPPLAPEIDPATGTSAFVLLSGAALVIRSRARR